MIDTCPFVTSTTMTSPFVIGCGRPTTSEPLAGDSGRRVALRALTGQPLDHPEVLTIPETGYLKGALLEALD